MASSSATFEDLGGFWINAYRPFLFASAVPFDGAFIDGDLGYGRLDSTRNRGSAVALNPSLGAFLARGIVTGSPETDEFSGAVRAGYDTRIGPLNVGPRAGLRAATWNQGEYSESGTTGLQLSYQSADQSSVQSTLGVSASVVVETRWGALLPQIEIDWVHEFLTTQPRITSRFIEAPASAGFSYRAQKPAANFATLDVQAVLAVRGRLRPYVDFGTLLGNGNYQSYGGVIGINCAF
jgi:outer membrane autotransporter protein